MVLNKWKDGSAGHLKAMAAAFVNALIYASIFTVVVVIASHFV
ncbi:hypothetical protein [Paraburkholderia phytofirmans]|uniref:Uncharacterized protein n=1 Tax=Paraburkholderia phytofirmans (strain DSM 17436 / LMG 22146 / PsJN) TaxID=398527 RepID=B2TH19_PARPJ|nr:hypothetical protein [Paraburkholderia phytofirmans]ACD21568.1 hypothetical protein Bphyt_7283 [Paraburkholderia phytofirmans PsJN]